MSKAFDKVWHNGLKYKIINLHLPPTITKLLCNFLDNRTASISIKHHLGPSFPLLSGVPQGSSLSPTLYTLYTADMPEATPGSVNLMYADDITQIVTHPSKSKNIMARRVQENINRVNEFEKKWKIKTNTTKFKLIRLAAKTHEPVTINQQNIPYSNKGTILGLQFSSQGIQTHVTKIKQKAEHTLSILRRFASMPERIKLHLIKALLLPQLTYPSYPLNAISHSNMIKLQRVQNKALRFVYNDRYPYTHTNEYLHRKADMPPINIVLHNRGNKTKNTLITHIRDNIYTRIINTNNRTEHGWFRKPYTRLTSPEPLPLYTS